MKALNLEQIILNQYLNNEDLSILVNNPKESDIRKIVNKIWKYYLSNPFDYQEESFNFLVSKNGILFMDSWEFSEYPIFHDENHFSLPYEIVDKKIWQLYFIKELSGYIDEGVSNEYRCK